jgi:hypothetical protein
MEDIKYFKGSLCQHRFLVCQEGFCSECMIHLDALKVRQEKPVAIRIIKPQTPVYALAART